MQVFLMPSIPLRLLAAAFLTVVTGTADVKADVQTLGLYDSVGEQVTIEELDAFLEARYAPTANQAPVINPSADTDYGSFVYAAPLVTPTFPIDVLVASPPAAPEPSTWAMMGIGFAGLGFMSWRVSRKAAATVA